MRSVAFILAASILVAIFLSFVRKKSNESPQKVAQVPFVVIRNITLHSLDVNISAVRATASDKEKERLYPWKTHLYHLQRVQFVASRLTIFAALPRTMDRSNTKLGEGIKCLF